MGGYGGGRLELMASLNLTVMLLGNHHHHHLQLKVTPTFLLNHHLPAANLKLMFLGKLVNHMMIPKPCKTIYQSCFQV